MIRAPLDTVHRILAGQTVTPRELRIAGWLVVVWFMMDLVQFIDWLWGKF
jgi:hypothetical protein